MAGLTVTNSPAAGSPRAPCCETSAARSPGWKKLLTCGLQPRRAYAWSVAVAATPVCQPSAERCGGTLVTIGRLRCEIEESCNRLVPVQTPACLPCCHRSRLRGGRLRPRVKQVASEDLGTYLARAVFEAQLTCARCSLAGAGFDIISIDIVHGSGGWRGERRAGRCAGGTALCTCLMRTLSRPHAAFRAVSASAWPALAC